MPVLTDEVTQDFAADPRVTVVKAPRVEFLAQDVLDTLRKVEDTFVGIAFPKLINASGKEELGPGKFVGITYQLQNNQIQFEDRQTPVVSGRTISTASGAPIGGLITVTDSGAGFLTALVKRGSFIVNWSDNSIVSVHSVTDEDNLRVKVPTSGLGNTYEIGDAYSVFNVVKVLLGGGNSTAVDAVPASIDSAVPSVGTFLTLESSTSAVLLDGAGTLIGDIHGQVVREVHIDDTFPTNGPNGYQQLPFNAWTSAVDYAEANNILNIAVRTDSTITQQVKNFVLRGINGPAIDFNGQDLDKTHVEDMQIMGSFIGRVDFQDIAITNVSGNLTGQRCAIIGFWQPLAGAINIITDVATLIAGAPWTLDLGIGNGATSVNITRQAGGMIITNMDNAGDVVHIMADEGAITIDATCSDGTIVIAGVTEVTDNSTGTTVVDLTANVSPVWVDGLLSFKKWIGLH